MSNPALVLLAFVLFLTIPLFFGAVILTVLSLLDFEYALDTEDDDEEH